MSIYDNGCWRFIEEHLNELMFKQCRDSGDLEGALKHSVYLIRNCDYRNATIQQQYLNHFKKAVEALESRKVCLEPVFYCFGSL